MGFVCALIFFLENGGAVLCLQTLYITSQQSSHPLLLIKLRILLSPLDCSEGGSDLLVGDTGQTCEIVDKAS